MEAIQDPWNRLIHKNAIRMACGRTALPYAQLNCHPDGALEGLVYMVQEGQIIFAPPSMIREKA